MAGCIFINKTEVINSKIEKSVRFDFTNVACFNLISLSVAKFTTFNTFVFPEFNKNFTT